jgi:hypothetical protein
MTSQDVTEEDKDSYQTIWITKRRIKGLLEKIREYEQKILEPTRTRDWR